MEWLLLGFLGFAFLAGVSLYTARRLGKAEQRADQAEEGSERQQRQGEKLADELPNDDDLLGD